MLSVSISSCALLCPVPHPFAAPHSTLSAHRSQSLPSIPPQMGCSDTILPVRLAIRALGGLQLSGGGGLRRPRRRELRMSGFKMLGIILLAVGVLALAYRGFSYTKETHKAELGPIELNVKEK